MSLAPLRAELAAARAALAQSDDTLQTMATMPLNMHMSAGAVKARIGAALAVNQRLTQRVEALTRELRRAEIAGQGAGARPPPAP